jgi:two-component system, NtrC family, response regulator HydG
MNKKVLIIDDDRDICILLSRFLTKQGYETDSAYTAGNGIAKFKDGNFDVVICDYRLGDKSGKDVLVEIKKLNPDAIVIIITGYTHIKTAVDVIKSGAYDYIAKPLITDEVLNVLNSAVSAASVGKEELVSVAPKIGRKTPTAFNLSGDYLVGQSKVILETYSQVSMVAPTDYNVILYGETGTGKEVVARTIHEKSSRSKQPFVAIDCGAISKELAGSSLFGHVKGAFTGALFDKEGHFEAANNGTIFLDEVSNLSYDVQATLLRVIQERKFKKVGGTKEMDLDIRIIVASNESLLEAAMNGKFREDLYHRFNEFTITLPALRNRKEDIPLFANFFLEKSNNELGKKVEGFNKEVMDIFLKYSWPGNLREFRNVVRRAVLLTRSNLISESSLPLEIINPVQFPKAVPVNTNSLIHAGDIGEKKDFDLKDAACRAEYETIMNVLKEVNFNKSRAAEILNIDRKTLYNKIKNYEESQ